MSNLGDRLESVKYHAPGKDAAAAHERFRSWAAGAVQFFDENIPAGREQSLAHTKLEEALMWAHKGIALHIKEK